jgi:hypothetical protein
MYNNDTFNYITLTCVQDTHTYTQSVVQHSFVRDKWGGGVTSVCSDAFYCLHFNLSLKGLAAVYSSCNYIAHHPVVGTEYGDKLTIKNAYIYEYRCLTVLSQITHRPLIIRV